MLIELRTFEKNTQLPRGLAQASLLANPKGARADRLVWHLSTHVLRAVVARDRDSVASTALQLLPQVSTEVANVSVPEQKIQLRRLIRATEAQAAYREHLFRQQTSTTASTQALMIQQAETLTSDLRALEAKKAVLTEQLRVVENGHRSQQQQQQQQQGEAAGAAARGGGPAARVKELVRGWDDTAKRLDQEVSDGWKRLEPMLRTTNNSEMLISDVVAFASQSTPESRTIDGSTLQRLMHAGTESGSGGSGGSGSGKGGRVAVDVVDVLDASTKLLNRLSEEFLGTTTNAINTTATTTTAAAAAASHSSVAIPLNNLGNNVEQLRGMTAAHEEYLQRSQTLLSRLQVSMPAIQSSLNGIASQLRVSEENKARVKEEKERNKGARKVDDRRAASSTTVLLEAEKEAATTVATTIEHVRMKDHLNRVAGIETVRQQQPNPTVATAAISRSNDSSSDGKEEKVERVYKIEEKTYEPNLKKSTKNTTNMKKMKNVKKMEESYDLKAIRDQLQSLRQKLETTSATKGTPPSTAAAWRSQTPVNSEEKPKSLANDKVLETSPRSKKLVVTPSKQLNFAAMNSPLQTIPLVGETTKSNNSGTKEKEKKEKRRVSFSPDTEDKKRRPKHRTTKSRSEKSATSGKKKKKKKQSIRNIAMPEQPTSTATTTTTTTTITTASTSPITTPGSPATPTAPTAPSTPTTPTASTASAHSSSGKKDLLRRKKLQQKMRMAVRSTPLSKQKANPLRAELMKLISALYRQGVITSEVRGELKDELIGAKTMSQLRSLHAKISFDVGNTVAPVSVSANDASSELPIPDIHELINSVEKSGKRGGKNEGRL